MAGHLVVSLDFELHWGIRDHTPLDGVRDRMRATRAAIPRILEVLHAHEVHATWATVGFLLARDKAELLASLPRLRPVYTDARLDPYRALDALGDGEDDDPYHFAPSLVQAIAETPGQEVGTHTLSHYYTLEAGQDLHHFAADLAAAKALHDARGLPFHSLVFPRNQYTAAHVEVAAAAGIIAIRGASTGAMYTPGVASAEGPVRRGTRLLDAYLPLTGRNVRHAERWPSARTVDIPSSRFLRPFLPALAPLEPARLRRITAGMSAAARQGGDFHLWWHPHNFGAHTDHNLDALRTVLDHYATLRDRHGMTSATMAERARLTLAEAA
jgi:peptidoglycan/xylan/chitin deacetylase (PgdA/CDA1 family)